MSDEAGPYDEAVEATDDAEVFEARDSVLASAGMALISLALVAAAVVVLLVDLPHPSLLLFKILPRQFWGAVGTLFFSATTVRALQGVFRPRVRLRVSPEGVLDRTTWASVGLIRWDEIVDFRKGRFGSVEIVLRNPEETWARQSRLKRFLIRSARPVVGIYVRALDVPRGEVIERLDRDLDAYVLAATRERLKLEAGEEHEDAGDARA